jgi:serine/threonine protein phosphatase 1
MFKKYTKLHNTFVIGDVHGCYHTLMKLIDKLPKNPKLIFVGDLCDKGNYSKEVIEYVMENKHKCILGNHEYLMLNNVNDKNSKWATQTNFGGYKTILSYENDTDTLQKHLNWIKTLPSYIIKDKFFITHGYGLPYYKRRDEESSKHPLMSNRKDYHGKWAKDFEKGHLDYDIINIFGHDFGSRPVCDKQYFNIDSGCVYGEKLTTICLDTKELISVDVDDKDIVTFEKGFNFVPSMESPYGFSLLHPKEFKKDDTRYEEMHSDTQYICINFTRHTKKGQVHKNFLFDKDKNYTTWKEREKQIKGKVETKEFEDGYKVIRTREINFQSEYEQTNDTLYKDDKVIKTSNSLATNGKWGMIDNIYDTYISDIQEEIDKEKERVEKCEHLISLNLKEQKKYMESEVIYLAMMTIFYGPIREAGPLKEVPYSYFKSQYQELDTELFDELFIHALSVFALTQNESECYDDVDVKKYVYNEAIKLDMKNSFDKYFDSDVKIDTNKILG